MIPTRTPYLRLPQHIRELLEKDPMALQRKHDAEVATFRLITKADVWLPKIATPTTPKVSIDG